MFAAQQPPLGLKFLVMEILQKIDKLKPNVFKNEICSYIHTSHRYILPLISKAQEQKQIPKPSKLIFFDMHHDARKPNPDVMSKIHDSKDNGFDINTIIHLCKNDLSTRNDDWLIAGMELGLISDVVIIGVEDKHLPQNISNPYRSRNNTEHNIRFLSSFLTDELSYQGDLVDYARDELKTMWEILNWTPDNLKIQKNNNEKWVLNIDLDCFAVKWRGELFPWPNKIFEKQYTSSNQNGYSNNWNGKRFFQYLLENSGLLVITREPECCGGVQESVVILNKVNKYLFDGQLTDIT